MLNKRGNSNCQERIDLIERFIKLFGTKSIDCLMADREFVGDDWIKFLNNKKYATTFALDTYLGGVSKELEC